MGKFERRGVLVYCLVGLILLTGSLGCCCGRDRDSGHVRNTHKRFRNIVTSVQKQDSGIKSDTLSDSLIKVQEPSDFPVEIINRIVIEEEHKKDDNINNVDKCECKPKGKVIETAATIPLKIFIDGKRNNEPGQLSILKGLPTELVAVSDNLELEIKPEHRKKVDISLGEIDREENSRIIKLTGKGCGDIIITNSRGDVVRVKVIIPLKVLEIGGTELDKTRPFTINKCRETPVIIVSDGSKPEVVIEHEVRNKMHDITLEKDDKGRWKATLKANESANVNDDYTIIFRNKCGGETTICLNVK
ncbi:MAG: hypothetical protein D8M57_16090 [Candidatus Scalindua sp. AMX11]|nr:MAG: hypothetical protein DWQ00_03565 [Candidatus Scalindua sp.]NOG82794.1 hypothetical protein [Planctomycetota bacterium]RZV69022.1 MAG: hypothetical protein EX341_16255 [Candidatus Scalindua sp. SCAELEC01]TDE63853.1 MAG: hypothetical protein D8M57_16090 [Candidatus Scalindua sp. AMX11]GJQ60434.1 MAG: hypothetical protein SCALA701_32350 [Candidatus Scalindua sp.]